jgi:hypothetical protein
MRTTVTLDPDVERLIKNDAHQRGASFKAALNEAVRKAFRGDTTARGKRKPFVVKAYSMGARPGMDHLRLGELADEMEIDAHLALTRRLKSRKK